MDQNCAYCMEGELVAQFGIKICELPSSKVYLFKEQSHKGRVIVAHKKHVSEITELTAEERAAYIEDINHVAEALHIDVDQVNIKATTEEGLGFTGTGEGISSQAIASLDTIANYSYQVGPQTGDCAGCGGCPNVGK